MSPSGHFLRSLATLHVIVFCAGCAKRDAALGAPKARDLGSAAATEAGSTWSGVSEGSAEYPAAAGSDPKDAGAADAAPSGNATVVSQSPTSADGTASERNVLDAGIDDATDTGATALDAAPPDGGRRDRELCELACLPSAELPCRLEQCHDVCMDEMTRRCATSYRPYLTCLASRDGSEFACDTDNYLVAPSACSEEEAAFVECWQQ